MFPRVWGAEAWGQRGFQLVFIGLITMCVAWCGRACAQEESRIRPPTGHVEELAAYLPQIEIYEPVVYRHLAVFPMRLRGGDQLRGRWLTMDTALARGVLVVREKGGGGTVPTVLVENRSRDEYVVLLAGELLAGGKQTRTVRHDVALAPGQRIELSVFCVESHRWEGSAEFSSGRSILPYSIQQELRKGADQSRIWSEVAGNNAALGAENSTGSLERALHAPPVREKLNVVRGRIEPEIPADSVGFLFVDRGRAVGADFFGRADLARALLPKLLDAVCVDFVLKSGAPGAEVDRGGQRQIAIEFFERIRRAGSQRVATPGSGGGIRTRAEGLLGDGVGMEGTLVHYGVHSEHRFIPLPTPSPRGPRPLPWPVPDSDQPPPERR